MAKVTFSDGRWVELRPMYVDDELAVAELGDAGTALESGEGADEEKARAYFGLLRRVKTMLDDAVVRASWDGGMGRLTTSDMLGVIAQWRESSEDAALPPANGTSSATP